MTKKLVCGEISLSSEISLSVVFKTRFFQTFGILKPRITPQLDISFKYDKESRDSKLDRAEMRMEAERSSEALNFQLK